ncbi:hypothetical protein Tco_1128425, partial [Tanacetum coccineum]
GPQKHKPSVSDDKSNEHSTCQSNDSEGSFGNPSEHSSESELESISIPKEMSTSKSVTTNEKVMFEPKPKDVEPSCVTHVKTPRQQMKNQETPKVNKKNWNEMMERELGEVQLNAVRPNSNSVRPNFNTGRANVNSVRSNVNTVRPKQPVPTSNSNSFSPVRPKVNKFNQRSNFSKSHSPVRRQIVRKTTKMPYSHTVKGNWGTAVKTSAGYNWRNTRPNSNCNGGSNFVRTDHPLKNMEDRGIFEIGCSAHMTGNKDYLDDFEECKEGSVTFGGSKGYITGKGRIRVAKNLAKVLTQRTKTYTRKVKTGLRRKLDADEVSTRKGINTGFTDVTTAFEEINSGDESIIPSPKKGQRERKAVLEEKSHSKKAKKQIKEEQASLAEIVRLQAQEEAENARNEELERQDALIAKRVQDELELSETQKNRMAQVQEAAKYYTEED